MCGLLDRWQKWIFIEDGGRDWQKRGLRCALTPNMHIYPTGLLLYSLCVLFMFVVLYLSILVNISTCLVLFLRLIRAWRAHRPGFVVDGLPKSAGRQHEQLCCPGGAAAETLGAVSGCFGLFGAVWGVCG